MRGRPELRVPLLGEGSMGTTRTRVALPPPCADGLEVQCGRESESRKTRVVRTAAIRDDRYMSVDVPGLTARILSQSLEEQ